MRDMEANKKETKLVKLNDHKRLEWLVNMNTMIYETGKSGVVHNSHKLQEKFNNCGVQCALGRT